MSLCFRISCIYIPTRFPVPRSSNEGQSWLKSSIFNQWQPNSPSPLFYIELQILSNPFRAKTVKTLNLHSWSSTYVHKFYSHGTPDPEL